MLYQKSLDLIRTSQDESALKFVEKLSDPILLINLSGEVYAKNEAFLQNSNNQSLNQISLPKLSGLLTKSFENQEFPLTPGAPVCHSKIVDALGRKHDAYLYPFMFTDTHAVVLESYNNQDILQRVLDCIPARVFWKDRRGKFLGGNHLFLSDCGLDCNEQLVGLTDYDFFQDKEADHFVKDDEQVMSSGKPKLNIEEPQTRSDGKINWLQTSKVPIRDHDKEVIGVMGSYTDITERKIYQEIIEQQIRQDQLTNLHNRQALQEFFSELKKGEKDHRYGGLLFIDLDDFKTVNDTLGHSVGDDLLKVVSARIKNAANENDFVARLGGDEFAVLLMSGCNGGKEKLIEQAEQLAKYIKQSILRPYLVDSHHIQLGVSIGITYFYSDDSNWANIFNEADLAMYDAKASDKYSIKVFSEELRTQHSRIYRMQVMLNHAIDNHELYLQVQPQFDDQQNVIGAEALLRWNSRELGEISPTEFIPVAEQTGAIHDIGRWVFEQAFSLVHQWSEKYGKDNVPPLAVNVSAKQFQQPDFLEAVEALLREYPIEPGLIHFELTESLLVESEAEAIEKIKGLSDLGFPLAIDDFGTGYSCLGYLNQLPIDKIKIDKSFTFQISENNRQAALVESIITMAKNLDMDVIAEGVETKFQLDFLLQHGCNEFQGFYFSRPVMIREYQELLDSKFSQSRCA